MQTVAIIGAGPAGLAAARWLKSEGFEPILFEQGKRFGGQWSGDPECSGVWPSLCTNTWRDMTEFSDLSHPEGTPLYPTNLAMQAYLSEYAARFSLTPHIRLETRVVELKHVAEGWSLHLQGPDGEIQELHPFVVVASGRFRKPTIPHVKGLDTFSGTCGVTHTFAYRGPERYAGKRVLVAGCAVSSLEVACELAMAGEAHVLTTSRRQRYILQKIIAGVPAEWFMQSRAAVKTHQTAERSEVWRALKEFILRTAGSPDLYGTPAPHEDLPTAGVTHCQNYLPLVADGRIIAKPWIDRIEGTQVYFQDGTSDQLDGLIFGTGFEFSLPFLSPQLREILNFGNERIDFYKSTFHPDLPGLAFGGMFQVIGPFFPPIELQARWIAYTWSGSRPTPSRETMIDAIKRAGGVMEKPLSASLTCEFASEAGVEAEPSRWPDIAIDLVEGPAFPATFRLQGRDALPYATDRVRQQNSSRALTSRLPKLWQ